MGKGITFITRHYPPNPNINGESVWDMVKYLNENSQIKSTIVTIDRNSEGGGHIRESLGNVVKVNPIYKGKISFLRFLSFLYDGYVLTKKAISLNNNLIICTTSPPLLPMWCSILLPKNRKWGLWAFDLFPEGFAVTNTIKTTNFFYKKAYKYTYSNFPNFIIGLGPKQNEHIRLKYNKDIKKYILPCGIPLSQEKCSDPPVWYDPNKIILGYCGNVNNAHNPEFIKSFIDNINPDKHTLILALYGLHSISLLEYASNKPGIIVLKNVPRSQLHFIDIHLVTLRQEWTHVAVPSKAISAVYSGSTIAFCGNIESDNWFLLKEAGWYIDENEISNQTTKFLESINREMVETKKEYTERIINSLKDMVHKTYSAMESEANM